MANQCWSNPIVFCIVGVEMKPSAFSQLSRRRFLARGGVAAAGVLGFPAITRCASPNNRLGIAIIGVGGRGGGNMAEVAATEDIVALCDVNAATLGEAARRFPGARTHRDLREVFLKSDGLLRVAHGAVCQYPRGGIYEEKIMPIIGVLCE